MKKSKYDQSKKAKERFYSAIIPDLKKRTVDKEEVMVMLGVSNRKARQEICEISMHYPVIAYAAKRGYRICDVPNVKQEDIDKEINCIDRTLRDLDLKKRALQKKMKPLIAARCILEKRKTEQKNDHLATDDR